MIRTPISALNEPLENAFKTNKVSQNLPWLLSTISLKINCCPIQVRASKDCRQRWWRKRNRVESPDREVCHSSRDNMSASRRFPLPHSSSPVGRRRQSKRCDLTSPSFFSSRILFQRKDGDTTYEGSTIESVFIYIAYFQIV